MASLGEMYCTYYIQLEKSNQEYILHYNRTEQYSSHENFTVYGHPIFFEIFEKYYILSFPNLNCNEQVKIPSKCNSSYTLKYMSY